MADTCSPLARVEAFRQRFGLGVPVLLAPMAGACPVSLSAAVANAGGLGACGALLMQPAAMHHLHTFDIEGRQYGDPRAVDDVADEKRVTLNGLIKSGVVRFAYTYDFGDNWEHALVIEKSLPGLEAPSRPICSAGKRRCPPEDCGGP